MVRLIRRVMLRMTFDYRYFLAALYGLPAFGVEFRSGLFYRGGAEGAKLGVVGGMAESIC